MAIYKNENGTLSRKDASAASQIGAVDTENILGGGAGAQTNTQALLDALAEGGGGGGGLPSGGSADDMLVKNSSSAGDASWKTPAQVKSILGVGDGHTIQNASGTDMTARAGLQFKSGKVSDDSVNDRTVVEQVVPLTEAEYQALPSSKNSDNTFYFTRDGKTQPLPSLGYTPVGTIISIMGTSAPTNFLACNGQTVNIADYPVLANYFLEQFGQINKFGGDGTTTFGIPDLRGEFLRGTGTNSHSGEGNGAAVGTHQSGTKFPYYQADPLSTGAILFPNDENANYPMNIDKDIAWTPQFMKFEGGVAGSYSLVRNFTARPTNTSVLYCIAVRDIYIGKDSALAGRVDAINERFNYSTAEKVVGKWIDNKTLYQKVYIIEVPQESNVSRLWHNTVTLPQTVDLAWIDHGHSFMVVTSQTPKGTFPLDSDQCSAVNAEGNAGRMEWRINRINDGADRSISYVTIGSSPANVNNGMTAYVVLLYTKTTDTAS